MDLISIHEWWAWVMVGSNAAVGVWALVAQSVPAVRGRALWGAVVLAEVAIFVQVFLGVAVISGRETEPYQFHMFYGFVSMLTVGLIYSYRAQLRPHLYLLYGLGSLFLAGLGLRAMSVSPVAGL